MCALFACCAEQAATPDRASLENAVVMVRLSLSILRPQLPHQAAVQAGPQALVVSISI